MGFSNSFEFKIKTLEVSVFASSIQYLVENNSKNYKNLDIDRSAVLPDGTRKSKKTQTFRDIEDYCELGKEDITISFSHKIEGHIFISITHVYGDRARLFVSCDSGIFFKKVVKHLNLTLNLGIPNSDFKTTIDENTSNRDDVKITGMNQSGEISPQEKSPPIISPNTTIEKSASKKFWIWVSRIAIVIAIILGIIKLWKMFL